MTKPNPFDAVISDLRWIISNHETADFAPIVDIEAAIRVLEAAGEVSIGDINRPIHGYVDPPVANLLEEIDSALPDKEPE